MLRVFSGKHMPGSSSYSAAGEGDAWQGVLQFCHKILDLHLIPVFSLSDVARFQCISIFNKKGNEQVLMCGIELQQFQLHLSNGDDNTFQQGMQ